MLTMHHGCDIVGIVDIMALGCDIVGIVDIMALTVYTFFLEQLLVQGW